MQAFVNLTCPYCGHKQSAIVDFADYKPYTRPQVVTCDSEEGGCDKWYVFEARATFTVTTGTIGGDLQPEDVIVEEAALIDWARAPDWAQVALCLAGVRMDWYESADDLDSVWVRKNGYRLIARPQAVQP